MYYIVTYIDRDGIRYDNFKYWVPNDCYIDNVEHWPEYVLRTCYHVRKIIHAPRLSE